MICSFYLSVSVRKIVCANPSLRCTSMLLGLQASKQPTNKHGLSRCSHQREPRPHAASPRLDHLVGQVARRLLRERQTCVRFLAYYWDIRQNNQQTNNLAFAVDLCSRSSHASDLKIDTPTATLPGVWCYRVSIGTGWTGVSILKLGEILRKFNLQLLSQLWQYVKLPSQIRP